MTARRWWFWSLVGLLAAGGTGLSLWFGGNGDEAGKYVTAAVERGDIEETVSAIGAVQPREYVDVGTQVTGQLRTLRVAIGDVVKQADVVAEIDPILFQTRVNAAEATIANLQAQLSDRQAQRVLAEQQYQRNLKLREADAVSEEALQESKAVLDQTVAQVAALRAQVRQSQSQLEGDRANLRYTKIYAPMAGTVVSLTARQGQTLVASQQAPTILRIADLSVMTVWAQVSEADVPKVHLDMPVYFNTLGMPERRWHGKVRQILPTPDTVNNVVLYNVLFDVDNPDGALKTQMSAQVYFVVAQAKDVLTVPVAALQPLSRQRPDEGRRARAAGAGPQSPRPAAAGGPRQRSRSYLVRVLKDGKVEEREVAIGVQTRLSAQVLSGLAEGEQVVVGTNSTEQGEGPARPARPPRF